ncbi:MAG: hypothetical protein K2X90_03280 [Candidatus Babeliaceae bacterium]|nr:hypothetical protein [Candidatus Babeliaceae bacterium]
MIKKVAYFCLVLSIFMSKAERNPKQYNAFETQSSYTITNSTQEPMDVTWQSGGGSSYDVLTGRQGSFYVPSKDSPSNSQIIKTSGTDCIDFIEVKSRSNGNTAKAVDVCKNVTIEYEGKSIKDQKIVLKIS